MVSMAQVAAIVDRIQGRGLEAGIGESRRQAEVLTAPHESTLVVMKRLELADLLVGLVRQATRLLGTPHGYIGLVEGQELEVKAGVGIYRHAVGTRIQPSQGLAANDSGVHRSFAAHVEQVGSDCWPGSGTGRVCTVMEVPLRSGPELAGVIGLVFATPDHRFGPVEIEVLGRLAQLASIALDASRP